MKRNLLDPLLRGYKTNELLPIGITSISSILRTDARLSLQQGRRQCYRGNTRYQKNLTCTLSFFGHKFTDEDKENLLETGNMGRPLI